MGIIISSSIFVNLNSLSERKLDTEYGNIEESYIYLVMLNIYSSVVPLGLQETCHEMRIPERDVTYIILSVYLLMLTHRYPLNRKQSH